MAELSDRALSVLQVLADSEALTSDLELQAAAAAAVTRLAESALTAEQLQAQVETVVAAFKSGVTSLPEPISAVVVAAAAEVRSWLQTQQNNLLNGLTAYVQQFSPAVADLTDIAGTLIAILNDGRTTIPEGRWLLQTVLQQFDLAQAVQTWVPPEWFAIAQRVFQYRQNAGFEATVFAVAQAYLQKFQSLLTPQLIEHILKEGSLTIDPQELLDGNLDALANTLFFKIQLLEASPPVTKTDEAIAEQVHEAVQRFHDRSSAAVDLSVPVSTGDLSVGSPWIVEPPADRLDL
ncbi:MAG: hypothetical protein F6J97_09685 [Leptolyngbya sp. SIO4C1]|nr:hypothetical protein [Leptolyngbya sp. SIO4C1]